MVKSVLLPNTVDLAGNGDQAQASTKAQKKRDVFKHPIDCFSQCENDFSKNNQILLGTLNTAVLPSPFWWTMGPMKRKVYVRCLLLLMITALLWRVVSVSWVHATCVAHVLVGILRVCHHRARSGGGRRRGGRLLSLRGGRLGL